MWSSREVGQFARGILAWPKRPDIEIYNSLLYNSLLYQTVCHRSYFSSLHFHFSLAGLTMPEKTYDCHHRTHLTCYLPVGALASIKR